MFRVQTSPWLRLTALGSALLLLVGMIGACSSGDDDEDSQQQPAAAASQTETGATATTATTTDTSMTTPAAPSAAAQEQFDVYPEDGMPQYGGQVRMVGGNASNLAYLMNVSSSTNNVTNKTYDRLVRFDWRDSLGQWSGIRPGLAESWETSGDGLTWTFNLRSGVTFHDGTPFTSEDVKTVYDYFLEPGEFGPPGRSYIQPYISSIDAPDPQTIVLNLIASTPGETLLNALAFGWVLIPPSEVLTGDGPESITTSAIGTGPYKFVEDKWERGIRMLLEANQDYWEEGIPFVDSILMFAFENTASQIAAFETKRIDDTRSASADQVKDLTSRYADTRLSEFPGTGTSYIHLNARIPPFDNVKVRQAMYLWLDRADFLDKVGGGRGFVGEWIFPGLHVGYGTSAEDLLANNLAWRSDKTEARKQALELLAEAGWSDLSSVKIQIVPQSPSGSNLRGNQILESQLKEMGFQTEITPMERVAADQAFRAGNFGAGFYGGGGQSPDPASTLNRYVASTGQRNYTGIVDPVFDKMLATFNSTPDPVKRSQIVAELDEYLQSGVWSMIPMYRSAVAWLRWDYLHGRFFMGSSLHTFDDRVWLGEDAPGR